jgi:hypothetical protein
MNILESASDPKLFRPAFKDLASWQSWMVYLRALFGLPGIEGADLKLFRECTGLERPPRERVRESFVICGRRSGKSFVSALVSVFLACFKDWKPYLAPGERGWIFIIAVDKAQAGIIRRYIGGLLHGSAILRRMVEKETVEAIDLKNGVSLSVKTCNFRSLRGYTVLCAIMEEVAFWRSEESANPDREVLASIKPALATIPESLLIGISTPYSRSGVLWEQFKSGFGQQGRPLIWKADSRTMNPTLNQELIDKAIAEDSETAKAEWLAEWRSDLAAFLSGEAIEACIIPGRFELPKIAGIQYHAFIDPSGGRSDSFTLGIAHREESGKVILDVLRERRPPFQPQGVVAEFSDVLKSYNCTAATSDRYAGEWVTEAFVKHDISIKPAEQTASELYLEFLPLITGGQVELLDSKRLVSQLAGLERRIRPGGKDMVTHYQGGHDDAANAAAGVCVMAAAKGGAGEYIYIGKYDFYGPYQGQENPDDIREDMLRRSFGRSDFVAANPAEFPEKPGVLTTNKIQPRKSGD